jgi:hypothetical protein
MFLINGKMHIDLEDQVKMQGLEAVKKRHSIRYYQI